MNMHEFYTLREESFKFYLQRLSRLDEESWKLSDKVVVLSYGQNGLEASCWLNIGIKLKVGINIYNTGTAQNSPKGYHIVMKCI